MISRYCILKIGILSLAALSQPVFAQPSSAQPSLIIRLQDDAPSALRAALEAGGSKQGLYSTLFDGVASVQALLPPGSAGKRPAAPFVAFTLTVADSSTFDVLSAAWTAQSGIAYAQPNHRYRLDGDVLPVEPLPATALPTVDRKNATSKSFPNDPMLDSLAHMPVIRAFEAWEITTGSPAVRIGFVDTGVLFDHPDLTGQFWINPGEDLDGNGRVDPVDFNGIDDDGNGFVDDLRGYDFVDRAASVEQGDYRTRDPDASEDDRPGGGRGHGTLIAGVLAAQRDNGEGIAGVAPGSKLVPLRAFGADGIAEDDDVAAAIVYAAQMGLDVINLSFGDVYFSPIMEEAIAFATSQGTVVVASAGNLGGDDPHYPSDYPDVISVAWLDAEGSGIAGRGTFGIGIDVGAPGSFIFTTLMPRLKNGVVDPADYYGRRSGSSLAAPMVSGAAALLRATDPELKPTSIRSILAGTAVDINEPGWDHRTAAGRLDVTAALLRNLPARVEIITPEHDAGWPGDALTITGSAITPNLETFSLFYAEGDQDLTDDWQLIAGPFERQRLDDTLAVWQTGTLPEGVYTLRLAADLRTGRTLEDRRRIYLDRSPPTVEVRLFNVGLAGASHGVTIDLETDDLTDVAMRVTVGGEIYQRHSDRRSRRHGVSWKDETGRGGTAQVEVIATNAAGLQHSFRSDFVIPQQQVNTAFFDESTLSVPHGYLLRQATDFDRDGLLELTLNRYQDGWIGDTLSTYEWDGADFRLAQQVIANVIPRAVGDPDGDGLLDLLTQVAGATLMLEQPSASEYPLAVSFIDTTGLANPFDPESAFGARLTDLDDDGRGEIIVHNTQQWRILEYDDGVFKEVIRLDNPTSVARSEISQNEFQQPLALIDDFDGDGRKDLVVGDGDGDWIVYEVTGDNALEVVWTYETIRYNAGARFAKGDFDGDGLPEFVTFTQNWTQPIGPGDREPDVGLFYFWDQAGDDVYVLTDSLPVPGLLSRHGGMIGADFDGDGRDELALVHAPNLYLLAFDDALRWSLRYHRGASETPDSGIRSIALTAADFDSDGRLDLIAAGADERLHRFVSNTVASGRQPPVWERAVALDAGRVSLHWRAFGADSVTVLRGVPGGALDLLATTTAEALVDETDQRSRYALRAWYQGTASPLSRERVVRPHAPAVVASVAYPEPSTIEVVFTEPLDPDLRADQFTLDASGLPSTMILGRSNRAVLLRFDALAARTDTLRWTGVFDEEGTPVGQTRLVADFPAVADKEMIITEWDILNVSAVRLIFSEALDPDFATDVTNYRLDPTGRVAAVQWTPEQADRVTVEVEGRAIGATGLETSLVVERMRSVSGARLAREGNTISLTQAADNLADVYVFPNPYREAEHQPRIVVAGLPPEATINIYSVQGEPVRRLEERDGDGGIAWDLTDEEGRLVPSGIYLVRVEAPDQKPALRKAAIIR